MKKRLKKLSKASTGLFGTSSSSFQRFYKKNIVYRLYWGRSNLYKRFIHISIFSLTLIIAISGFTVTAYSNQNKQRTLLSTSNNVGDVDLLEQGGSVESILLADTTNNFKIIEHKVKSGESYKDIASKYGIEEESIKLSNLDKIDYYKDTPPEGETLRVAEINGLLLKVDNGDTLNKVKEKLKRGNELDIIEINNLRGPDYSLPVGEYILVPDGLIEPPAPAIPQPVFTYVAPQNIPIPSPSQAVLRGVQFVDPLFDCGGYSYSRGFTSWHNGVDLAKGTGCWIRSAAAGTIEFAGWSSGGEGFMVRIDHGNGVKTLYFHGNGQFNVQPGQYVSQGTAIMYMGRSGYSTGVHLHLSLKLDGVWINPAPYVPYWRP